MATVPAVPTFTAGSTPAAATLNALGYACSFLLAPPKAVLQQTNIAPVSGGQAIAITTATAIIWTVAINNGDSAWSSGNPTRFTCQTPGYYLLDAVWQSTAETTAAYRGAYFRITTGVNNPGGAGLTTSFGSARVANVTSATGVNYTAVGCAMISPLLYVLDYVELIAYAGHAETTGFTDGGSYLTAVLASLDMPTTDQLQAEINGINTALARHYGYILALAQQIASLQQRCTRLETQDRDLQDKLAKVKKG